MNSHPSEVLLVGQVQLHRDYPNLGHPVIYCMIKRERHQGRLTTVTSAR